MKEEGRRLVRRKKNGRQKHSSYSILKPRWQLPVWHWMSPLMKGDSRMPNIPTLRFRRCRRMSPCPTGKYGEVNLHFKSGLRGRNSTLIMGKPQMRGLSWMTLMCGLFRHSPAAGNRRKPDRKPEDQPGRCLQRCSSRSLGKGWGPTASAKKTK